MQTQNYSCNILGNQQLVQSKDQNHPITKLTLDGYLTPILFQCKHLISHYVPLQQKKTSAVKKSCFEGFLIQVSCTIGADYPLTLNCNFLFDLRVWNDSNCVAKNAMYLATWSMVLPNCHSNGASCSHPAVAYCNIGGLIRYQTPKNQLKVS